MITLQAPHPQLETTTILPNPDFSDVQGLRHNVTIRRSMNGFKRTYINKIDRQQLVFNIGMTRMKGLELRAFVESYFKSKIRLTTHKNEIWIVNFTINPFEFFGAGRAGGWPGAEKITITLNFEGEKNA